MGVFRGGLLVVVSIILFLTLLLGNVFLVLSMSLQYDNVRDALVPLAREFVGDKSELVLEDFNLTVEMEEAQEAMQEFCKNDTDYVFSEGGYTFDLPCELVNESPETFFEEGIENIVEQTYYKEYDCDFWDCFGEGLPFFLISEKAKDYWKEKFYFAIVASLIFVVLMFFLVVQKQNFPILFGSLLALSSLPLLKLGGLASVIGGDAAADLTSFFFSSSNGIFWALFIIGLIILGLGIAWRILTHDSIKKKLSKKDVKQIIKSTKK